MVSGIFANISGLTRELRIEVWDFDDDGKAVWKCSIGDDDRYVEADVNADVWLIIDAAARAYDEV